MALRVAESLKRLRFPNQAQLLDAFGPVGAAEADRTEAVQIEKTLRLLQAPAPPVAFAFRQNQPLTILQEGRF